MYDQWWAFKGFQMTLVCRSCSDENFINITCTKNSWNTLTLKQTPKNQEITITSGQNAKASSPAITSKMTMIIMTIMY